jgi:hypoxanthine phosphoribosyltransferase
MHEPIRSVVFNQAQIQQTIHGMAGEISAWVKGKPRKALNLVSILEGARPFTRDLTSHLKKLIPETEIFIYEVQIKGTDGTSLLEERRWLKGRLESQTIQKNLTLLVDDLVDSGLTLKTLKTELLTLSAKEVKTAVLLRKFGEESGPVDFCGFDLNLNREVLARKGLKDYWLFGYGMDLNGQQRELEHIGWVEIR